VPVYFDQFASRIVNTERSIVRPAEERRVSDCVALTKWW